MTRSKEVCDRRHHNQGEEIMKKKKRQNGRTEKESKGVSEGEKKRQRLKGVEEIGLGTL